VSLVRDFWSGSQLGEREKEEDSVGWRGSTNYGRSADITTAYSYTHTQRRDERDDSLLPIRNHLG
jgi:hypothetical protein